MKLNELFLAGNLTRDIELRYTANGTAIATTGIAYNEKYNDIEKTYFFDVKIWGKQAESCNNYLRKGSNVFIKGKIEQETWQDKETGKNRSKVVVVANTVNFLDKREPQDVALNQSLKQVESALPPTPPPHIQAPQAPRPPVSPMADFNTKIDEDIPF